MTLQLSLNLKLSAKILKVTSKIICGKSPPGMTENIGEKVTCINESSFRSPFFEFSRYNVKSVNIELLATSITTHQIEKYLIKCPIISVIWSTFTSPFAASSKGCDNSFIVISIEIGRLSCPFVQRWY